jgi:hypothetical protein
MAKIFDIYGRVLDQNGKGIKGVFITPLTFETTGATTTNDEGYFQLPVDERELQANFFYPEYADGSNFKTLSIPSLASSPGKWTIRLQITNAENTSEPEKKKMNLWPVYAGAGLLLLLWLKKRKKKRGKK